MQASAFAAGKKPPVWLLDKRITIQAPTVTQDDTGAPVTTWEEVDSVWAYINPLSGHELVKAQALCAEVTHLIILRWQSSLADPQEVAKMRLVYGARTFGIASATNIDERRRWIALSAVEGLA